MPTSETTENQPIEQMVQLLAPPLPEAHFGLMWSAFAIKKNIEVDDGDLMIDDRQIVLAQLHFAVADLGGSAMVTENDAWSLIGGRMGWIDFHFPEGPHCSPSVATRLQCVYDRYLAAFDQVYQQLWYMNAQRRSQLQDMFPVQQRHPPSSVIPSNEDQQTEYQYSAQQQHSQQQSPFQTSLSIPLGPDNIPVAIVPIPETQETLENTFTFFKATSAQDQIGMTQNTQTYNETSQLQPSSFAHDLAHALDQQHFGAQMFGVDDTWSPCFSTFPLQAMCSMDMDGLNRTGTISQNVEVIGMCYPGPSVPVAGTEAERPMRLHPENVEKEIERAKQGWSNEEVFSTYPDIPFAPAGPQNPAYPETYQRLLTLAYQVDSNLTKIICLVLAEQVEQVLQNVVMMTSLTWHQRQQAVHNRYILDLYKMGSFIQYLTYIIVGAEMQPKFILQNEAQLSLAQQSPTSPPPSAPVPPPVFEEGQKRTPPIAQTSSAAAAWALARSPIPPSVLSVLSSLNSPPVSSPSSRQKCDRRRKPINTAPPAPTKSLAANAAPLQIALTPSASISTSLFEKNKKRPREEEANFATETSTSLMLSPKRSKSESVEQIADGILPEANEDSVWRSMFDSYIEIPVTAPPAPDPITTTTASFVQGTDMRVGTGIACIGEVWGYYPLRTYSEGQ